MTRLIDADALKKDKFTTQMANGVELEDIEVVPVASIDNAPTVDITEEQAIDKLHETGWLPKHDKEMTERPKGEWLKIDDGFYKDIKKFKCSECEREVIIMFDEDLITKYPFCHCGADMKEVDNDKVN